MAASVEIDEGRGRLTLGSRYKLRIGVEPVLDFNCHVEGAFASSSGGRCHESAAFVKEFYKIAISSEAVARAIAYAIEQPKDVDINEIVLRPTQQEF